MNIVIHYGEIGVKGGNRRMFESQLISNVKKALKTKDVKREYGKIVVHNAKESVEEILKLIPGIKHFSFAEECGLDMISIEKLALKVLKKETFKSFKINTKRSNKNFPLKSMEINSKIGEAIQTKLKKTVNLKTPDLTLFIEIGEKKASLYQTKIKGVGGLPIGTAGKVVSMLSGGIDSPVASFLMMRRGCTVVLVHFMSQTNFTKESVKKVEELTKQLTKVQLRTKLYLIPFLDLQTEIIKKIPSKYRMIIYRRYMTFITNLIARKEKAKAIVTGDSIGQVASQTLNNLNCIYDASDYTIFSPLIGMDKTEIIDISRKIKTYELSILPYQDCCSFMIAEHPELSANIYTIKKLEESIDKTLIQKCFEKRYDILF